jgi:hypothetical protein
MITRDEARPATASRPARMGAGQLGLSGASGPTPTSSSPRSLGNSAIRKPFSPHDVGVDGRQSHALPDKLRRQFTPVPPAARVELRPATASAAAAGAATNPAGGGSPTRGRSPTHVGRRPSHLAEARGAWRLGASSRRGQVSVRGVQLKSTALDETEGALIRELRRQDAAVEAQRQRRVRSQQCIRLKRYGAFSSSRVDERDGGYVLQHETDAGDGQEHRLDSSGGGLHRPTQLEAALHTAMFTLPAGGAPAATKAVKQDPVGNVGQNSAERRSGSRSKPRGVSPPGSMEPIGTSRRNTSPSKHRHKQSARTQHGRRSSLRRGSAAGLSEAEIGSLRHLDLVFPNVTGMLRRKARHARAYVFIETAAKSYMSNEIHHIRETRHRYFRTWMNSAKARFVCRKTVMRRVFNAIHNWAKFVRIQRYNLVETCEGIVYAFRLKRIINVWFRHAFVVSRVREAHNEKAIPSAVAALNVRLFNPPRALDAERNLLELADAKDIVSAAALQSVRAKEQARTMSRAARYRRSTSGLETHTIAEWTSMAVNFGYLKEVAHGTMQANWPMLRAVLRAWRSVTDQEKREKADRKRIALWRRSHVSKHLLMQCWGTWRLRMHKSQSSDLYRTSLVRSALSTWRRRCATTRWCREAEVCANSQLDDRLARSAFFKWQQRYDKEKMLETLAVASIAPHAARLMPLAALMLGRPEDQPWLTAWRMLQRWRAFVARRRTFQVFIVQQCREYNTSLLRRSLVVWRSRGNVSWATGQVNPNYRGPDFTSSDRFSGGRSSGMPTTGAALRVPSTSFSASHHHRGHSASRSFGGTGDVGSSETASAMGADLGGSVVRGRMRNAALASSDQMTAMTSVSAAARGMPVEYALAHLSNRGGGASLPCFHLPLPFHTHALPVPGGRLWSLAAPINFQLLRSAETSLRQCDDIARMPPPGDRVCLRLPSTNEAFSTIMNANAASITAQKRVAAMAPTAVRAEANRLLFGVENPRHPPEPPTDDDEDGGTAGANDAVATSVDPLSGAFAGFLLQRIAQALYLDAQLLSVWRRTHASLTQKAKVLESTIIKAETQGVLASLADTKHSAAGWSALPGMGSSGNVVTQPSTIGGGGGPWSTVSGGGGGGGGGPPSDSTSVTLTPGRPSRARPMSATARPSAVPHVFSRPTDGTATGVTRRTDGLSSSTTSGILRLDVADAPFALGGPRSGDVPASDSPPPAKADAAVCPHRSLLTSDEARGVATGYAFGYSPESVGLSLLTPREMAIRRVAERKQAARRAYEVEQRAHTTANAFVLCRSELPPHMFQTVGIGSATATVPDLGLIARFFVDHLVSNAVEAARRRMFAAVRGARMDTISALVDMLHSTRLDIGPTGRSCVFRPRLVKREYTARGTQRVLFLKSDRPKVRRQRFERFIDFVVGWRCRALERVLRRDPIKHFRLHVAAAAGLAPLQRFANARRRVQDSHLTAGAGGLQSTLRAAPTLDRSLLLATMSMGAVSPRLGASGRAGSVGFASPLTHDRDDTRSSVSAGLSSGSPQGAFHQRMPSLGATASLLVPLHGTLR